MTRQLQGILSPSASHEHVENFLNHFRVDRSVEPAIRDAPQDVSAGLAARMSGAGAYEKVLYQETSAWAASISFLAFFQSIFSSLRSRMASKCGFRVQGDLEIGFPHGAADQLCHQGLPSPRQNA
jgi:hypothetical protein